MAKPCPDLGGLARTVSRASTSGRGGGRGELRWSSATSPPQASEPQGPEGGVNDPVPRKCPQIGQAQNRTKRRTAPPARHGQPSTQDTSRNHAPMDGPQNGQGSAREAAPRRPSADSDQWALPVRGWLSPSFPLSLSLSRALSLSLSVFVHMLRAKCKHKYRAKCRPKY